MKEAAKVFLVLNNYQINEKANPHKSYGYLRTEEFSSALNEFIGYESMNAVQTVLAKAKSLYVKLKDQHAGIRDRIKQMK